MTVGIDKIAFFTPNIYLDLSKLAQSREVDPNKFLIGIGQSQQAVVPLTQDSVSMAANAAEEVLKDAKKDYKDSIDAIYFATESGIDNSKSGATIIQRLLGFEPFVRTMEFKQACYAGTFALMSAFSYVAAHPDKRVLVLASDISRYGLNTPGEVTQGAGAVAMVVSSQPSLLAYNEDSVYMSQDINDFWRPLYSDTAFVDGKYSQEVYKEFFLKLWNRFGHKLDDFAGFAFHLPFTKMANKALEQILSDKQKEVWPERLDASKNFSRRVGNLYTGSLYLSLISLLKFGTAKADDKIGMFSYGSGAEAELFSLTVQKKFKASAIQDVEKLLDDRSEVSVAEYEKIFASLAVNGEDKVFDKDLDNAKHKFVGIDKNLRIYE